MQPTHLGPYQIGKQIGKGGMGSVYEAIDSQTGLRVAVKALSPHLANTEGFRERFEAEIDSLKTLRHEGIVRLFGYGEQDGLLFYSMELVEGSNLEEELKAGRRFQWREVVDITIQLCKALKHAHDHGIVHRDIKPANILIDSEDQVKLADFGIARLFGSTQLTTVGGVLGTADYMSPEQADGRPVTDRCDQYSLGGVMYALLAGRPPFRAKNLPEMLQMQRFAEPEPIRRYASQTPQHLELILDQLLAKDPADRFPNTLVLARLLEAMVRALSRPAADDFALADDLTDIRPDSDFEKTGALSSNEAESETELLPTSSSFSSSQSTESPSTSLNSNGPTTADKNPESRFTTLAEERAQQQLRDRRNWLPVVAEWFGLIAVLASLGGMAWYLTRPETADSLYAKIETEVQADDPDTLRHVQREIGEFLTRFPNDSRAVELQGYQKHLELDRLERDLKQLARRGEVLNTQLLPIERFYLEAVNEISTNPDRASEMLQSILALFDGKTDLVKIEVDEKTKRRQQVCLRLARQRLTSLQEALDPWTAQQLASLREQFAMAERLATTDPERAQAMVRAIVVLYQDRPWAKEIVERSNEKRETRSLASPKP